MFPEIAPVGDMRMAVITSGPVGATSEIGLHAAARRGLDVRLLVPDHHQDSRLIRYASQTWYADLLEAGVRIYEYQPTMIHVKTVSVDREWAIVGSANFDNRSFIINFEISVAVFDAGFVLTRLLREQL